ncbi:MAG: hypothetical protein C4348_02810 [Patescibacteria group bacterium]
MFFRFLRRERPPQKSRKEERPPEEIKEERPPEERPPEEILKPGAEVKVIRSSGIIEGGWRIVEVMGETVVVSKKEGSEELVKEVPVIVLVAMNAPETTRFGYPVEKWLEVWQRWGGGELTEDAKKLIEGKTYLTVKDARKIFSKVPSEIEERWKAFENQKRGKAVKYDEMIQEFIQKYNINVSEERSKAEILKAIFGKEIPLILLNEEERDKLIRRITGA